MWSESVKNSIFDDFDKPGFELSKINITQEQEKLFNSRVNQILWE